jgi:hypothetical protein
VILAARNAQRSATGSESPMHDAIFLIGVVSAFAATLA